MGPAPISALALGFLTVMSDSVPAQVKGERLDTPRQAAEAALPTLRRAATGEGAQLLGFRSANEVAQATLGEPLSISVVALNTLRTYDASKDPGSIIVDAKRMLFPVLSGSTVRTGIEVSEKRGAWGASAIGGASVAVLLDSTRAVHRASAGQSGNRYFAVQVPALNLYLLAAETASGLLLIPLADDPRFPLLRAGVPVSPADAIGALVPAALLLDPKESS